MPELEERCPDCGDTGIKSYPAMRVSGECNRCTKEDRERRAKAFNKALDTAMSEFKKANPNWRPWEAPLKC